MAAHLLLPAGRRDEPLQDANAATAEIKGARKQAHVKRRQIKREEPWFVRARMAYLPFFLVLLRKKRRG